MWTSNRRPFFVSERDKNIFVCSIDQSVWFYSIFCVNSRNGYYYIFIVGQLPHKGPCSNWLDEAVVPPPRKDRDWWQLIFIWHLWCLSLVLSNPTDNSWLHRKRRAITGFRSSTYVEAGKTPYRNFKNLTDHRSQLVCMHKWTTRRGESRRARALSVWPLGPRPVSDVQSTAGQTFNFC